MSEQDIKDLLKETGALMEGHFLLTSGRHSNQYIEKFQLMQYPDLTAKLCTEMIKKLPQKPDVVVGPVTGGMLLAYELGKQLGVRAIFTERENGKMTLRRGFQIKPGEKVLVAEDIITTGGSVKEVLEVMQEKEANVLGVTLLIDRSGGKVDLGVPTMPLLTLNVESFEADNCPICKQGIPITKRGSKNI